MREVIKKLPPIRRIINERESYYNALVSTTEALDKERKKNDNLNKELMEATTINAQLIMKVPMLEEAILEEEREKSRLQKLIEDKIIEISVLVKKIKELSLEVRTYKESTELLSNQLRSIKQENSILLTEIKTLNGNYTQINSKEFWENRYKNGLNSGTGSYSRLAEFKAKIINEFLEKHDVISVIEFGCGDGNQLSLMNYKSYVGVDVSKTIIANNKERFKNDKNKRFFTTDEKDLYLNENKYDLSLSLDVIFHLTEDEVYEEYMNDLLNSSKKYIIVYSSNHEEFTKWPEFRHRKFMKYVQEHFKEWELISFIPNIYPFQFGFESDTSTSDFYIFKRVDSN